MLQLALFEQEISFVAIVEMLLVGSQWVAGKGLEPRSKPIAAHRLGFDFEHTSSTEKEELLDCILLVANVPDPRNDTEESLQLDILFTPYMRKLLK